MRKRFLVITSVALGSAAIAIALDPKSIVSLLIVIAGSLIQISLLGTQKR
jgi:hypothetical protein